MLAQVEAGGEIDDVAQHQIGGVFAAPGARRSSRRSPASGPDGAAAVPGLLECIAEGGRSGIDAHVIACFDDTGLDAARALAAAPVVGIGEAAYRVACLVAGRFGVVTTMSRSIPVLEQNLGRYGLAARCGRVRATDVPVLMLETDAAAARKRISAEIAEAVSVDRAEAIVLGCAGMAPLAASLSAEHGLPVVEGVSAAVKLAESLVALRLATSKIGGWAEPHPKARGARFDALLAEGAS